MSGVDVYRIGLDGVVVEEAFADVRNAPACAPTIWAMLCESRGRLRYGDEEWLWKQYGTGTFTRGEDAVLAFTFDGAYVAKENIPELATHLEAFARRLHEGIVPTIAGVAAALRRLDTAPDVRGACFQMTSVNGHPWMLRPEHEDGIDDDDAPRRPFNFDRDRLNAYGAEPLEVFARAGKR